MPFVTKQQVSAGASHCVLLQDGTVGTCDVIKMSSRLPCENMRLKFTELQFCLLFCMGVKLGLLLRKERRLRVFGPKVEEVMGNWRKLHNEELHD